ncbi:GIY-YIG nuclease family protein [Desulfovibrio ferrophilus]|uniref:Excinuclease ABC subunit C n=1 Tax=Desulfovibrio ferrophilus TaxID=241368 RepID=A0A2Z6B0W0_9BACT|nr:GIY-YIG nuclease family protein [Desulfovibrio ferrophilus]BBD09142.1 excinuclease ABC subunit C [Desulfovibrio ferrophilus]
MAASDHPWTVYLLRCADDTLYCGITTDIERRLREHNAGTGAKYTRSRTPVVLAASARFEDRSVASRIEYAVKQRPASDKIDFLVKKEQEQGLPLQTTNEQ